MKLEKSGLASETIEKLRRVFARHPEVTRVILYGSRAKGNFKASSDIDLTLFPDAISLNQLLEIELEIDELLLPYKVDLCVFKQIENPDLIEHINRVGIEFYSKNAEKPNR